MGLARGTVVTGNGDRPAAHLKVPGMPGRDEQARPMGSRSETVVLASLPARQRGEGNRMDNDIRAAVHKELVTDPARRRGRNRGRGPQWRGVARRHGAEPEPALGGGRGGAARRVADVTVVHNILAIGLPSRDYGDEAALAQLVNAALAANRAVPDGVRATAREGDVFLTGTVIYSARAPRPKRPRPTWSAGSASPIRSRSRAARKWPS